MNLYSLDKENKNKNTYIKKKSSDSKINYLKSNQTNNGNPIFLSNKNSVFVKHSKNHSISTSLYKVPKNFENNKISHDMNNKDLKSNYLYSSKNNSVGKIISNKSVSVPEYSIKLENLKSRVSNLLNVYSLLALRSLNDTKDLEIENKDNKNKK